MAQMMMKKWKYTSISPMHLLDKVSEVVSNVRHAPIWYGSVNFSHHKILLKKYIEKYLVIGKGTPHLQEDIEALLLDALEVDVGLQQALASQIHG